MWNKKTRGILRLVSLLLALLLCPSVFPAAMDATGLPELTLAMGDSHHTAYMQGFYDGTFRPDAEVSRGEAAHTLYCLLGTAPQRRVEIGDVPPEAWYYDAVSVLAAYGVMDSEDGFHVEPEAPVTRREFARMLACFFPRAEAQCLFWDVPYWVSWYPAVALVTDRGWMQGYEDGGFHPGGYITRAEMAATLNRVLGRQPDREAILAEFPVPVYPDLSVFHWAYADIMEAVVSHSTRAEEAPERWQAVDAGQTLRVPGIVFVGDDFYYVGPDGKAVTNQEAEGFYFGPDGRYTSGDLALDNYVKYALSVITTPGMPREEKLRKAFTYTRDSFTYLRRNYYQIGDTGWELQEAKTMFETGRGNCYCYAAVFYFFARQLGYDVRAVSGVVGTRRDPHGWVELESEGVTYIFDPELEMAYRGRGYTYNLYRLPYSSVPWPYVK